MRVRVYALPPAPTLPEGSTLRRPLSVEAGRIRDWITARFDPGWAEEIAPAHARQPVSMIVAQEGGRLLGLAACEVTARGFFGPMGVDETRRGTGLGAALLLAGLRGLAEMGYARAIIGDPAAPEFYARACGAVPITGSEGGVHAGMLRPGAQERRDAASAP